MTGSTHFLAGAAIGKLTNKPIVAIVGGFLMHFIMDMIPHWDLGYLFCSKWTCYLMAISDPIFGIVAFIILGVVFHFNKRTWIMTFLGGLAGLFPDAASVLIKTFQIEQLRWFVELHAMAHTLSPVHIDVFAWAKVSFTTKQMLMGLAVQIPFILASLFVLVRKNKKKIKYLEKW